VVFRDYGCDLYSAKRHSAPPYSKNSGEELNMSGNFNVALIPDIIPSTFFPSNERASFWKRTLRHLPRQRQTKSTLWTTTLKTQYCPVQVVVFGTLHVEDLRWSEV